MICCYDLFMAWFCCYDFDMVSVRILIWFQYVSVMILGVGQTCDLKPTHRNHIQNIPKSYQNHIKIVSKPYQNRIKIVSKPQKPSTNRPKTCPWAVSVSFFEANSLEPHKNRIKIIPKPYQNRIKNVSKSCQNRIKTRSKSYQNHKNPRNIDQKPIPALFLFLFWKPTRWNHIKTVSKSYQNRIKIVSKSYQNRIKTISKSYWNHHPQIQSISNSYRQIVSKTILKS